jgi:RNA polymerase sigma-70 factor (ECF subfamily)
MSDGVDAAVAEALALGHARWPNVILAPAALIESVLRLAIPAAAVRARGDDLFLATACAAGEPTAIAVFEELHLGQVASYVARLGLSAVLLDELRQRLRVRLLVERPPRIAGYRATGPLGGWVRVATIRMALDLLEAADVHARQLDGAEILGPRLMQRAPDDEILHLRYQPVIQAAFRGAIAALDEKERAILRFHYVEDLSIDAIGAIYSVHRATAARWVAQIRQQLLRAVQAKLAVDLQLSAPECVSLIRLLREDLRLGITSALG